ncbi:MAG: hypothetical protein QOE13_3481 [Gaiellaceae bacterium]|nr:hypothetical protein [Gaiellaceae bacterium]
MRRALDASNELRTATGDRALPAEIDGRPPAELGTGDLGRAYRGGRLVCGCVRVTVGVDGRLGLAPRERRLLGVRFHEPLEDALRAELLRLLRRRGSAGRRAAERVDPIEFVVDDLRGERRRIVGWLQPPLVRHGQLRDIEFGLRELGWRA